MKAYTDRLVVENIEPLGGDGGEYGLKNGRAFKKATVLSAGKSPNGNDNEDLVGKEILFFATVEPEEIPIGEGKFLMKRTNIEVIL